MNINLIKSLLFGNDPKFPNMIRGNDSLPYKSLTMGTVFIGRQGSGKTSTVANHVVCYTITYPDRTVFILDWSGDITNKILNLIQLQRSDIREKLLQRVVYDRIGDPDWVVPLPEFSKEYGDDFEEQVKRVSLNLERLAPELVKGAPFLAGLGLREIAPQAFRLLTSVRNEYDESFQITEVKRILMDGNFRHMCVEKFGHKVPTSKWFFEKVYNEWKDSERDLRTWSILALLGAIEPKVARGRVGYYKPGWTPKESIEKGLIVIIDGSKLINLKDTQYYLFTQAYSLIMAEINKRSPANPNDKPVSLVLDEVYCLLQIPGMAEEIGMISPIYRSRKLQLYVIIQALWQLEKNLREKIWSLGNTVCFSVKDFQEAYEIAQQMFKYEPRTVKQIEDRIMAETDRGQFLTEANYIQNLGFRECLIKRYWSEKSQDKYIRHILKTTDFPKGQVDESLESLKERLLKQRAVPLRDALEVVNKRGFPPEISTPPVVR